jgi:hypothetical protein
MGFFNNHEGFNDENYSADDVRSEIRESISLANGISQNETDFICAQPVYPTDDFSVEDLMIAYSIIQNAAANDKRPGFQEIFLEIAAKIQDIVDRRVNMIMNVNRSLDAGIDDGMVREAERLFRDFRRLRKKIEGGEK